jgi:ParB family chromosome partitioning protein
MTVRQVERLVRRQNEGPRQKPEATPSDQLERSRIQDELQRTLGTKVGLRANAKGKGTIEIAFYSFDDLERLFDLLRRVGR